MQYPMDILAIVNARGRCYPACAFMNSRIVIVELAALSRVLCLADVLKMHKSFKRRQKNLGHAHIRCAFETR